MNRSSVESATNTPMTDPSVIHVEPVLRALRDAVASASEKRDVASALRIAVALSGGRDSMVLLDALARLAPDLGFALAAVHIHHGLSAHADAWEAFCATECAARNVPFVAHRVHIARPGGASLEAVARTERYAALAKVDADVIALAHHADDQAETLLLQLLRGAGPAGLAAMPAFRAQAAGPALLRPFLALSRAAIDAYAKARGLDFVDDESNANTGVKRNFIRHDVAPRVAAAFPGYPATLARAAAHQAEAALLIDDLAALDAADVVRRDDNAGMTLERGALIALAQHAPHRARNLLRWFLRQHGLPAPSAARLGAMFDQLANAPEDARVRLAHAGMEVGFHRGWIVVHAPAAAPFAIGWRGEPELRLPHGTLTFATCIGSGIARAALESGAVSVRSRAGGERLRLSANRPPQTLKRLLQMAKMAPWQRDELPLIYCGAALAAAPGIGVDVAFQAVAGAPGFALGWHPRSPRLVGPGSP